MPAEMRIYVEIGFNILYLVVVWTMTVIMSLRLNQVSSADYKIANLFRWAFVLLALGDTGHVGFRLVAYALGGLQQNSLLVGLGALATAITVTFFYVVMLYIWKERFNGKFGLLHYILLVSVPARFIVMAFPQNDYVCGHPNPGLLWTVAAEGSNRWEIFLQFGRLTFNFDAKQARSPALGFVSFFKPQISKSV